jgi:hypothetical protein
MVPAHDEFSTRKQMEGNTAASTQSAAVTTGDGRQLDRRPAGKRLRGLTLQFRFQAALQHTNRNRDERPALEAGRR